ncbi:MAG TPA: hypothetical protein VGF24_07685 [Vicinamibacterales bacterium]|jgi:hypothetical protein
MVSDLARPAQRSVADDVRDGALVRQDEPFNAVGHDVVHETGEVDWLGLDGVHALHVARNDTADRRGADVRTDIDHRSAHPEDALYQQLVPGEPALPESMSEPVIAILLGDVPGQAVCDDHIGIGRWLFACEAIRGATRQPPLIGGGRLESS